MIWCIKTYIIANVKTQKVRYIIHYVKPTAQLLFKIRFPKGGPTCSTQMVNPRVARCDIKGSIITVLNPIFWKKVQGQKYPGRWGIVEHHIPSKPTKKWPTVAANAHMQFEKRLRFCCVIGGAMRHRDVGLIVK